MTRLRTGLIGIGSALAAQGLIPDPSCRPSESVAGLAIVTSQREEQPADLPHTHVEAEPHHVPRVAVAQAGPGGIVPFIDTSSMDAANQIAINARHTLKMATYQVAMMANMPSFVPVI